MTDLAIFLNETFAFTDYEDTFIVADDGTICVHDNNIRAAGMITNKLNKSKLFDSQIVKLGKRGDAIILGFDTMATAESIYTVLIGPEFATAEIKRDSGKRFLVYLDNYRYTRTFSSLRAAQRFVGQLDQQLNTQLTVDHEEILEFDE